MRMLYKLKEWATKPHTFVTYNGLHYEGYQVVEGIEGNYNVLLSRGLDREIVMREAKKLGNRLRRLRRAAVHNGRH